MKNLLLIMALGFSFLLSACGGSDPVVTKTADRKDPKDEVLFEAVTKYIALQGAPPNSVYDFARVDLNGDGMREGIVLFKLPHMHWCGWDGCGMAIFRAGYKSFSPMTSVNGVRGPIYVSATGNQGWRDIIIRISGTKMRDKNVVLAFDGRGYPSSPMLAPTLTQPLRSLRTETFFR